MAACAMHDGGWAVLLPVTMRVRLPRPTTQLKWFKWRRRGGAAMVPPEQRYTCTPCRPRCPAGGAGPARARQPACPSDAMRACASIPSLFPASAPRCLPACLRAGHLLHVRPRLLQRRLAPRLVHGDARLPDGSGHGGHAVHSSLLLEKGEGGRARGRAGRMWSWWSWCSAVECRCACMHACVRALPQGCRLAGSQQRARQMNAHPPACLCVSFMHIHGYAHEGEGERALCPSFSLPHPHKKIHANARSGAQPMLYCNTFRYPPNA